MLPELQCGEKGGFLDSPELCVALTVVMQELDSQDTIQMLILDSLSFQVPVNVPFIRLPYDPFRRLPLEVV